MSVRRRIEELEQYAGKPSRWCECAGKITVRWDRVADPDSLTEVEPERCPACGKPIYTVTWPENAEE